MTFRSLHGELDRLATASASSGQGPCTGSTGCPSTASRTSPGRTPAPGAASGERASGSDDSPGAPGPPARHRRRPGPGRRRVCPTSDTRHQARNRRHVGVQRPSRRRLQHQQSRRCCGSGPAATVLLGRSPSQSHAGRVRVREVAAHEPPGLHVGVPPGAAGSAWNRARDLSTVTVSAASSRLPERRHDPQLVVVVHDQPGAVAADVEPVDLAGDLGDLALAQVVPFQGRARRVVVQVGAALAEHAGDLGAAPGQAALDRPQAGVAGLDHRDRHHAVRQAVARPTWVGSVALAVLRWPARRPPGSAEQRAERQRGLRGQRHQVRADAERERQVKGVRVVDRVEAAPGQERQVQPVGGEHRRGIGEPAVGHVDDPAAGGQGKRTIRIRRSGLGPPWDQASQAESGDQASPDTGPSSEAASSVTWPEETSTARLACRLARPRRSSPRPARPPGRPRCRASPPPPADRPRVGPSVRDRQCVGAGGIGDPYCPAGAEHPRQPGPGARLYVQGGSRAVLVRQPCTVPRTSTTLACPVWSKSRSPR